MQFSIPAREGNTLYKPGTHSREELRYAFKALRAAGDGPWSILLGAVFHELYPSLHRRFYRSWQRKVGLRQKEAIEV